MKIIIINKYYCLLQLIPIVFLINVETTVLF